MALMLEAPEGKEDKYAFASPQCSFGVYYLSSAKNLGFKGNSTGSSTETEWTSRVPSALTNSGIFRILSAHRKGQISNS